MDKAPTPTDADLIDWLRGRLFETKGGKTPMYQMCADRLSALQADNEQWERERGETVKEFRALTAKLTALQADARWIPVGERLPEEGEPVLVVLPDDNGIFGVGMDAIGYGGWLNDGITHWMPLPAAPNAAINAREGKS